MAAKGRVLFCMPSRTTCILFAGRTFGVRDLVYIHTEWLAELAQCLRMPGIENEASPQHQHLVGVLSCIDTVRQCLFDMGHETVETIVKPFRCGTK
jgi:hypothetical protein